MNKQHEMINRIGSDSSAELHAKQFFLDKNAAGFYEWNNWSAEKGLERLVFRVSKTPKYLQGHLERIYYCYDHHLDEALYGALIDLFIVLGNDGKALAKRMFNGTQTRLQPEQASTLYEMLAGNLSVRAVLPISRYSVFIRGLVADQVLVEIQQQDASAGKFPLALVKDFIGYNQLDEAIRTLEKAVLDYPERTDLHEELLSLYKTTRDQPAYKRMTAVLANRNIPLPSGWGELSKHFDQFKSN